MDTEDSPKHQPRAIIAPITPDTPRPSTFESTSAEILPEQPFDIHSYELIDIWERKIKQRLADLKVKNAHSQQDRETDTGLAPLYLEVLHRKQRNALADKVLGDNKTNIPRLHSPFDLYDYVNQLYDAHREKNLPWPLRLRAAVLSIEAVHDVPYDIYADERGISILSVDSLALPYNEDEFENFHLTKDTLRNIKSIANDAIGVQQTGHGCEMNTYFGIKVFFKREDAITQKRHDANLAKATTEKTIQFTQKNAKFNDPSQDGRKNYSRRNSFFVPDFFKTMQQFERFADLPSTDPAIVGKNRNKTLEQYKVGTFQEMFLMSNPENLDKTAKINTKLQRQRFRLYTDTLALIDELKQQHREKASDKLREIIEANTPMLPRDWQQSISSWITHSDDMLSGPVHLLRDKAEEKLFAMAPAKQFEAICELLDATAIWKIASLRLAALEGVRKYQSNSLGEMETILSRLIELKDQWKAEPVRPESSVLDKSVMDAVENVMEDIWQHVPIEDIANTLENSPPQWREILLRPETLQRKMQDAAWNGTGDFQEAVVILEMMTSKNMKIGKEAVQSLEDPFVKELSQSDEPWAKEKFVQWFVKAPASIKEALQNTMVDCFPEEMALQQRDRLRNLSGAQIQQQQEFEQLPKALQEPKLKAMLDGQQKRFSILTSLMETVTAKQSPGNLEQSVKQLEQSVKDSEQRIAH
ncbi:MAG: hypothetical protein V4568_12345 [Pseudomonadota bacterium]